MTTFFDHVTRLNTQCIPSLRETSAELERELTDARESLERELAQSLRDWEAKSEQFRGTRRRALQTWIANMSLLPRRSARR